MSNPVRDQFVSIDDYFALEERSLVRHEYVGGRMHAMSGVTRQHGEKAVAYRGIPSLRTYVVIEQERRWVERHWRDERVPWQTETLVESGDVRISHPAIALTLREIYEGVEMPSPEEYSRRLRLREEAASYG